MKARGCLIGAQRNSYLSTLRFCYFSAPSKFIFCGTLSSRISCKLLFACRVVAGVFSKGGSRNLIC